MRIGQLEFRTARSERLFLLPTIVAPPRRVELFFEWTGFHFWTWAILARLRSKASIELENRPTTPWP